MTGGFQLNRTQSQGDLTGKQSTFEVDAAHATLLAPGDVVVVTGNASSDGVSEVDTGVAATANTGILMSVDPNFSGEALSNTGLPATTAGSVKVNVDIGALYDVDVDTTTLVVADIDLNIELSPTTATLTGGLSISNMTVDGSTVATTATLPFTVVALLTSDAGVFGDRCTVRVNASTLRPGATGIA